jgi:hypothetical protein
LYIPQKASNAEAMLIKRSKAGGITLLNFKTYYKAIVIKIAWFWHKNRHTDQWDRLESQEIKPHIYDQLIFYKAAMNTQWGNEQSL